MASIKKRPDGKWRARYRDRDGREHAKHFDRKVDAQGWLDEQTAAIITGQWADPRAGRETFAAYAERWAAAQAWRPKTATRVEATLRNHLIPAFGTMPMASVRRTDVQGFVKRVPLSPSTVKTTHAILRQIFRAAVEDRVIAVSPCTRIALPAVPPKTLTIPDVAIVHRIAAALPERWRAVVYVAAGLGLRPGECLGLDVSDVDFLRQSVEVRRQLDDRGCLVPLKTAASYRTVPLPDVVRDALAAHLAAAGRREGLVFVGPDGAAVKRNSFVVAWRSAVKRAGAPAGLRHHDMRHVYASALIAAGQSVKVIQKRMGHASAAITLDVYGHLWPDSDEKTRAAVDDYLSREQDHADSVRTATASGQVKGGSTEYLEKG